MKVLDQEAALTRVGGDVELLREIGDLFQLECPRELAKLREAIESGDGAAVGRVAHGLKGSAANFGAGPAVEAALKIEQLARVGQVEEARGVCETLEKALDVLLRELKEI